MKAKNYSLAIFLTALLAVSAFYLKSPAPPSVTAAENLAVGELSAERYAAHVSFLASDDMKGRGNGSPELERAGDYLERQFRMSGLKPAGDDGSYFQKLQVTMGAEIGPKNALQVDGVS